MGLLIMQSVYDGRVAERDTFSVETFDRALTILSEDLPLTTSSETAEKVLEAFRATGVARQVIGNEVAEFFYVA